MSHFLKYVSHIKKIVLVGAVFLSGLLIGCTTTESSAGSSLGFNMEFIEADLINWVGDFYLYEDSETHVEYMVYKDGTTGIAITPRYNADGSLYIKK